MKVLVFSIGLDRYGLPLRAVTRVLPAMALKQIPLAPSFVAGLMDLHGTPVPVINLSLLAGVTVEQTWLDTRIVLVEFRQAAGARPLGLLTEHVIGIEDIAPAALADSGIAGAPFLGQVAGSLQLIDVDHLLTDAVRPLLYPDDAAEDAGAHP